MICRECHTPFDADDGDDRMERLPYGEGYALYCAGVACPHCGSEQVEEERECSHCEQECSQDELEDGLCRLCVEETIESLRWLWSSLTPAQRVWASEHTEWMDGSC